MIPDASTSPRCCAVPNSKDVIAQLLDDMISNVASVASKQKKQQLTSIGAGIDPTASHILTARAAEPPKSAITALKEGIDATCDEISSIAAMEALNGGPHASLLPTQPPKQPGAAPQVSAMQVTRHIFAHRLGHSQHVQTSEV